MMRPSSIRRAVAARYSCAEYLAPCSQISRSPGSSRARASGVRCSTTFAAPANHRTSNSSTGSPKPGSAVSTFAPSSAKVSAAAATAAATSGSTSAKPRSGLNATRRPVRSSGPSSANGTSGGGSADQSRPSGPQIASSSSAASATVFVIGPTCASVPNGLAG